MFSQCLQCRSWRRPRRCWRERSGLRSYGTVSASIVIDVDLRQHCLYSHSPPLSLARIGCDENLFSGVQDRSDKNYHKHKELLQNILGVRMNHRLTTSLIAKTCSFAQRASLFKGFSENDKDFLWTMWHREKKTRGLRGLQEESVCQMPDGSGTRKPLL